MIITVATGRPTLTRVRGQTPLAPHMRNPNQTSVRSLAADSPDLTAIGSPSSP
ncbi:hypothetical protein HMPREF9565_01636 [Cutibacterium acnes HL053PA2]|nr:hypothetical protein HMPREF9598_01534 [Cutibacterium acnes HL050PA1]EFT06631.1 hypothetical protein HMPREF9618_01853 [Cutibacterium acnes HL082PA1]EFT11703.1 hypothetical protein HMPREF9620_02443 [Cutibacterium acnes HL037PA1]EFT49798.1 hypothetical protein HMPREF9565_01636 [Cutibacterium acnes HL053PA2]EFT80697.1 hypothetical protein HMPREF9602_01465 [Cutibacterium acnes HL030PA2]EGF66596.1 hypothetical protein HMPREF9588_02309 [Cutibacterium acnes HL025PA2]